MPDARARSQDRFRCPLVKDEQLSPARSAFLRQVLPSVRSRGQEPATVLAALPPSSRLPALFRPFQCSRMKGLDPARLHRLIARGREDRTPLVEFCNRERSASTARTIERTLHTAPGSPPRAACLQVAAPLSRRSQPRFHGPGAGSANAGAGSFLRDRSRRKLIPNPISSNTSCRKLVSAPAGEADAEGIDPVGSPASPPGGRRFRMPTGRAASRALPRRRARSAAPEVPSIDG